MSIEVIPLAVYQEYLEAHSHSKQPPLSAEDFYMALQKWYHEFQEANCTLGYAAQQLGITKIDLIALLDMLGWKVTNI